jgi:CheY-like chemotaxis protein
MMTTIGHAVSHIPGSAARRVVVVDGSPEILELLETALDGGRYDLSFAEAGHHAYSLIKREQPDLVVLTVDIDEIAGFHLLSMLKLDGATRHIPVVTLTASGAPDEEPGEPVESDAVDASATTPPLRLH